MAYRTLHSTETALTYVTNDILSSIDKRNSVFLVLLDLSAAFNTVDHKQLLERLEKRVGLSAQVRDWVVSYLSSRYQFVSVAGSNSELKPLACGVPQDLVLRANLLHHLYAPIS